MQKHELRLIHREGPLDVEFDGAQMIVSYPGDWLKFLPWLQEALEMDPRHTLDIYVRPKDRP